MGQRLLIILAFLLLVRPITLVKNLACDEESIPAEEVPCSDIAQPLEIAESGQHCPCFALMMPESTAITANARSYALIAAMIFAPETAVANTPTPPPRLV
jgi:hypothetical protein